MEKKTPLYACHEALGGKIVPFAGYLLPVQYSGVIEEHMAVRERAGLFDVSHMGEFLISGEKAEQEINRLFTNDFTDMPLGRVRYSLICNESGGAVDDILVYKTGNQEYLIVVNAANREKDYEWIRRHITDGVGFEDVSDSIAQIALQGPKAAEILGSLCEDIPEKYYTFIKDAKVGGIKCMVSRTGYTGSAGYELYCAAQDAAALWSLFLDAGKPYGLIPCGLGARDTLRLEAGMPLYSHEISEDISPLEAGLGFAVKMNKPDFIGKSGLEKRGAPTKSRVGLRLTGRGISREHNEVYAGEARIGLTTSGTHLPYLGGAYAMALLDNAYIKEGTAVQIDVRGRKIDAVVVSLPFFKL